MQTLTRALSAVVLMGLCACSASADGLEAQSSEVQGGTKDGTTHNYAVGIANKSANSVCSGTLIAPNLVLTARHCVERAPEIEAERRTIVDCSTTFRENTAAENLFVTTEPVIRGAKVLYNVAAIATPAPEGYCGNDIALLRLAENIPAAEAEPAIPVVQFSIGDKQRLSGVIAAVGYGITAPNARDPGTRRLREEIDIICLPGDDSYDCSTTIYSTMIDNDREFITRGHVCSGDSGGGAFDQGTFAAGGQPYVLGALSRGPQNDTQCLAAIYSRTDKHADLIIDQAKQAAEAGGYAAPGWATGARLAAPSKTAADGCEDDICTDTDGTEPEGDRPAGPTTVKKTTVGCSAAPGAGSSSLSGIVLVAAALAFARRRRAR